MSLLQERTSHDATTNCTRRAPARPSGPRPAAPAQAQRWDGLEDALEGCELNLRPTIEGRRKLYLDVGDADAFSDPANRFRYLVAAGHSVVSARGVARTPLSG